MKFSLSIDLARDNPSVDMRDVARHAIDMVQMADSAGFEIVWAAEHHAIEMTIAPNPFQLLAWFGANTDQIRLGIAVVQAPYWHPIKVAGEVGLLDLMSGGRVEFGIGRGAYQREFDRMMGGMDQHKGVAYMQEMLPVLKGLWAGDHEHRGEFWSFPSATACPKPLQKPHPPLWVAARHPSTYDWALSQGCNIMSWALTRPFSEVEKYRQQFEDALARVPEIPRPRFLTMRHAAVYQDPERGWQPFVEAVQRSGVQFENLFKQLGEVKNGFVEAVDLASLDNAHQSRLRHARRGDRQAAPLRGPWRGQFPLSRDRSDVRTAEVLVAPVHRRGDAGFPEFARLHESGGIGGPVLRFGGGLPT